LQSLSSDCILVDWVSITSRIHSIQDFISLLGLTDIMWEPCKGRNGYRDGIRHECVSIYYNGQEDMGIMLDMSGQGCRFFETCGTGNFQALFDECLQEPDDVHLTRLDVAFDDHSGILDIEQLRHDTQDLLFLDGRHYAYRYISQFRKSEVIWSYDDNIGFPALTVVHGSNKSEVLIRIYDKAKERGFVDRHWIRVELQLRRERAMAFIRESRSIGEVYRGVVYNYLRYVEPDEFDSNRSRWPLTEYWSRFLAGAEKIRLFTRPGVEYNMLNLEKFVFDQAGNAIDTYIRGTSLEKFLEKLREHRVSSVLPVKYRYLLDDLRREEVNRARYGIEPGQQNKNSSDGT
jgi:phage replication initiation protein